MRSLSPEEAELWARVASTIKPLSREKTASQPTEIQSKAPLRAAPAVRRSAPTSTPPPVPRGPGLDGTWDRRLSKGSVEPDRVLDLHGMSLDSAWRAIDLGLERAVARGERVVLLITGHHRPGEPPIRRWAIRAAIHDWLAASRHAGRIAAVRGAHRRHGGGGSLYIILRRAGPSR